MTRVPGGGYRRRTHLLLSPVLAGLMLLSATSLVAGRGIATADSSGGPARPVGYDVSYPQCGGPLPVNAAFGIVGVNGGRVYSPNPCLGAGDQASQLAWAGPDAELYANTGNPGPRLSRYWPIGQSTPRSCTAEHPDSRACAYDYGWNAAADSYAGALAAYISLGWADADATHIPVDSRWWLDVEAANSWRRDTALNVAALQGAVDYLESMDVASVGFYSAPRMWRTIAGRTDAFADHPSWVAGASTLHGAIRVCRGEGFTGGPIELAQYFSDGFDANHRC